MLVFIPAITMGIWAEERRQGTDELLLTIPATDFDVVAGKYLSAVAIFTVGLVFSYLCNLLVLVRLGSPDVGQFISTYIGYWLIGLMMLAAGMVASFLTHNLTVAFVLGALFNAPLVILVWADSLLKDTELQLRLFGFTIFDIAVRPREIREWSVGARFADFGRGVMSLSSVAYFLGFTALMLYLCMVLIGRRHWLGGRDGHSMLGHFAIRAVALAIAIVGVCLLFRNHDLVRADVSSERLSSLSSDSIQLVRDLEKSENKQPIEIHAYLSDASETPESYIATRLNLISTLREFEALGSKKLIVKIHNVQRFDDETDRAEHEYGIKPEKVPTQVRGSKTQKEVMLGLAFRCGLEKVVVPFVGKSLPVEYEIARSLANVSEQKRKKLGLVTTDVRLGSLEGAASPLEELKKQYDVVEIDLSKPFTEKVDVLLALQPSSLSPEALQNFVSVVQSGAPTAIFEDPFPTDLTPGGVVGTTQPKQAPGGSPFMQQPPMPKGDIRALWNLLEVDFCRDTVQTGRRTKMDPTGVRTYDGDMIVWHNYNPFPKMAMFGLSQHEWVYVGVGSSNPEAFNPKDPISAHLQNVLLPFPGAITQRGAVVTSAEAGKLSVTDEYGENRTFKIDDKVVITINGKRAKLEDLQKGILIRVMTDESGEAAMISTLIRHLDFTPLLTTGRETGSISVNDVAQPNPFGGPPRMNPRLGDAELANKSGRNYVLAARIAGKTEAGNAKAADSKLPGPKMVEPKMSDRDFAEAGPADKKDAASDDTKAGAKDEKPAEAPAKPKPLNVVLVADVDVFSPAFFSVRSMGLGMFEDQIGDFTVDNVAFVLNALDDLAGEKRFIDIRKRRHLYRSLTMIDEVVKEGDQKIANLRQDNETEMNNKVQDEEDRIGKKVKKMNADIKVKVDEIKEKNQKLNELARDPKARSDELNKLARELNEQKQKLQNEVDQKQTDLQIDEQDTRERLTNTKKKLEKERDSNVAKAEKEQALAVRGLQDQCKKWSVALPPILPLLVAAIVFFVRRSGEREGVSRSRLR